MKGRWERRDQTTLQRQPIVVRKQTKEARSMCAVRSLAADPGREMACHQAATMKRTYDESIDTIKVE